MAANSQQSPVDWEGEKRKEGARGDVMTASCCFPWNPKDSLCVPRKGVPAWPGQTVLQSGGAGRQKTPLGSQYPRVEILAWSRIPLHQDGPWHGWEGAVGQVSLGRTSSSTAPTSSGGTTSPHVWGHSCCSSQCADMNTSTRGEPLTEIPLTNVSSGGSSKDKLGVFDNVLQQGDREIT